MRCLTAKLSQRARKVATTSRKKKSKTLNKSNWGRFLARLFWPQEKVKIFSSSQANSPPATQLVCSNRPTMPWCFNRLPPIPATVRVLRCPFRKQISPHLLSQMLPYFITVDYAQLSTRSLVSEVNLSFSNNIILRYKPRTIFLALLSTFEFLRVWWAGFSRKYQFWLAKNKMIGIKTGSHKPYMGRMAWFRSAGFLSKIEV